jgi:hypothetical protein
MHRKWRIDNQLTKPKAAVDDSIWSWFNVEFSAVSASPRAD